MIPSELLLPIRCMHPLIYARAKNPRKLWEDVCNLKPFREAMGPIGPYDLYTMMARLELPLKFQLSAGGAWPMAVSTQNEKVDPYIAARIEAMANRGRHDDHFCGFLVIIGKDPVIEFLPQSLWHACTPVMLDGLTSKRERNFPRPGAMDLETVTATVLDITSKFDSSCHFPGEHRLRVLNPVEEIASHLVGLTWVEVRNAVTLAVVTEIDRTKCADNPRKRLTLDTSILDRYRDRWSPAKDPG